MLSQKELAALKREQAEFEAKRAELKSKCKNHRGMTEEELAAEVENLRTVSSRLDEIDEKLKGETVVEKRGFAGMLKDAKGVEITEENYRSSTRYRDAFYRSYLNGKIAEADTDIMAMGKRAITDMNGGSVTSGAEYLVPQTTLNSVYSIVQQYGKLYAAITKYAFTGDVTLPIGTTGAPTANSDGTATLNFTFTEVKISQGAVVGTVVVKNLLLRNSIPAFEQYLAGEIGKYIGLICESSVLTASGETGTSFLGIVTAIKASPSAANIYSIMDWQQVADICAEVESPYGDNATWVMKRSTFFKKFFAITDAAGKPLVTVTPVAGGPGQSNYLIAGQPVIFSSQMPDTDSVLYGDLSTYIVNESEAFTIESNASEKFSADETVWRGKLYSGGKPLFAKTTFTYWHYEEDPET